MYIYILYIGYTLRHYERKVKLKIILQQYKRKRTNYKSNKGFIQS